MSRSGSRVVAARIGAVAGSAGLYGWAFPPEPHPWLSWLALAPLFFVLREMPTRSRLVAAWAWSVAMAYTVNDWFPRAVSGYFGQPFAVGIGLFLGVATLTAGLQYMVFAAVYPRLVASPGAARSGHPTATGALGSLMAPLLVAAAWVAADLLRLRVFGGDPWAILGYSQARVLPLVQIADVGGVHAVTFVVVAVNAAIVEVVAALRARRALPAVAACASAVALVLGVSGYGAYRLRAASLVASDATVPPVPVAVVQAHLPFGSQWHRDFYGRNLETYLEATAAVLRASRPRLVVWPENAMTFFVADEPGYRRAIAGVLRPYDAELVAGGPQALDGAPERYLNAAFLIAPDGEIRARYDKRLLLPFAEYFPFGTVDLLRRSFGRVREFTPGDGPLLLTTAAGPAGMLICNEAFFAETAATRVRAGATVLLNLSNDSWLADPKYSEPAFDMVTFRAVEQRRWIVRASTAGPSAIVDPFGRVVARTRLFETTTLAGSVEPRTDGTLYGRIGDAFAWACGAATALASFAFRRRAR